MMISYKSHTYLAKNFPGNINHLPISLLKWIILMLLYSMFFGLPSWWSLTIYLITLKYVGGPFKLLLWWVICNDRNYLLTIRVIIGLVGFLMAFTVYITIKTITTFPIWNYFLIFLELFFIPFYLFIILFQYHISFYSLNNLSASL